LSHHRRLVRAAPFALALSISALFALPAHAFSDDEARRAILELRAQFQQATDQNRQARLQLADQIENLRHEVASLRGKLEKINWELEVSRRAGQDQSPSSTTRVSDPAEQAAFEGTMGLFRGGKYKEAADGFAQFLRSYPDSQLAPEARFYRGSSLYANKDFKGSIQELQEMVKNSPQDPRAADALLVIAASQIEQNDVAGAKASLQRIIKDYPETSAAETAKSRLKLLQ